MRLLYALKRGCLLGLDFTMLSSALNSVLRFLGCFAGINVFVRFLKSEVGRLKIYANRNGTVLSSTDLCSTYAHIY